MNRHALKAGFLACSVIVGLSGAAPALAASDGPPGSLVAGTIGAHLSARPLAGVFTNPSGSQTLTWEIKGAKQSPSQKGRLSGTSGVVKPGKTLTVTGTLTMVAIPQSGLSGWEDLWQGASLKGSWLNVKTWKPVMRDRHVSTIGPGTYAYPYTAKVKIPKKVPKKAIANAKRAKGPLVPGEVLVTLFTGACMNTCDPDSLAPHNDWEEIYLAIGVLKK
ncbi:MAG: hypothetical protein U0R23_10960 [Candidatus Nanopelagicales bacterium]